MPGDNPSPSFRDESAATGRMAATSGWTTTDSRSDVRPVAPEQEAVKAWIRAHEELALLCAFAAGVFIGSLMRS